MKRTIMLLGVLFVSLLISAKGGEAQQVTPTYTCFPTCNEDGGRFLTLAGTDLDTLVGVEIALQFAAPADAETIEIGVFDGETGATWDEGVSVPLQYTLYASPTRDPADRVFIATWDSNGVNSTSGTYGASSAAWSAPASMINDGWWDLTVETAVEAQAPSGAYFYTMVVTMPDATNRTLSNFKFRTDGSLIIEAPATFAFIAYPFYGNAVGEPSDPGLTTYDGNWEFLFDVTAAATEVEVWDGDFDYGDCDAVDDDDPNTVGLPVWSDPTSDAVPEGVAQGTSQSGVCPDGSIPSGSPAEDNIRAGFEPWIRPTNVTYDLIIPDGTVYHNSNPSGNVEWERFVLGTVPNEDPELAPDYVVDTLPEGLYRVQLLGVDVHNLNAWRMDYDVIGKCEDETLCRPPLRRYLIGDYVWYDANANGLQDEAPDAGIEGVLIQHLDDEGNVIASDVTDANGYYEIPVPEGTHTNIVAPSNFEPGGALYGLQPTTPESQTYTVVDANVLTFDFGYVAEDAVCEPDSDLVTIDFEMDADGNPLAAGEVIADQYSAYGVSFSTGDAANHPLMIFDTGNPTGGDIDLQTPGYGPNNNSALGNVLIISEDGDSTDPDDDSNGGVITMAFERAVSLVGFSVLDIDKNESGSASAYSVAGMVANQALDPLGDNSFQQHLFPADNVSKLEFTFSSSAALGGVSLCLPNTPPDNPGTGTPGYWKNHAEAWPVEEITVGGVDYTVEEALAFFRSNAGSPKGDKSVDMFQHLVSAMLNVYIGNDPACVSEAIEAGNEWMATYGPGSDVSADSEAWTESGEAIKDILDAYNNGMLCAPARAAIQGDFMVDGQIYLPLIAGKAG